ncbi:sigma factor-like helix-turn-helix DNA-binding protein [Oceanobacillus jeddahense]|uniref:sigma factor-like helix-turn-helix DNA-binding protein n=1 Tax=Oceanobacillus jeddahense TaxID=1462527 RepID=UPI000595ED0F|nr:sigma factor-like helix-turn-helix DNA-binding protein [Oceanobacillus jeddahense]
MRDYVLIPNFIDDVHEIHSHYLNDFFQSVVVEGNKFSLATLRQLYMEDRDRFITVTDELALRGFTFFTEKPNNILPSFSCDFSHFIDVTSNKDVYKQFNFQRHGLTGFQHRFQVESDLFFHKIPIGCFKYINASVHERELENEFRSAGFNIISLNDAQNQAADEHLYETVNTHAIKEHAETYFVKDVFQENKYNTFRLFCRKKNIDSLDQISASVLEEFKNSKGVGAHRFEIVRDQLIAYGFTDVQSQEEHTDDTFIIADENYLASTMKVKDIFYENTYNKFLEFCEENNIDNISEITHQHIKQFAGLPKIGKKKVEGVKEKLHSISEELNDENNHLFTTGDLYPYLKDMELHDLLNIFEMEMELHADMAIDELEGRDLKELEHLGNLRQLYQLSHKLQKLSDPAKVLKELKRQLNERELVILSMRFSEGNTLEGTGQQLGLTRERVRQLEKKIVGKIERFLEINQFTFILSLVINFKPYISDEALRTIIGDDHADILDLFKEKEIVLYYAEELEQFFLDENQKQQFIEKLNDIVEELPETFNLKDYDNLLEDILQTDHDMNIELILQNYGYNRYGRLYSLNRLGILQVLELIFQNYIHEPVRLDDASADMIRDLAAEHFDYQLGESLRSIEGRLRDSENIILVDKNTFQWFEPEQVDPDLIEDIKNYLTKVFETRAVINAQEVYETFEDRLTAYQVFNKLHLYSVIKFFLDEEFDIGKGNTLNIYRDSEDKLNAEDRLIATIKSLGGVCSRDELEKVLKWPRYKIDLTISSSDQMITWEKNKVRLFDTLLTQEEKEALIEVVNNNMEKGYTTSSLILEQIMFDKVLAPLIHKKDINSSTKMASIIKNLMPSVKGHSNFLYVETGSYTTFEDVILDHFREETTRKEIQSFILEHGFKDLMALNYLNKIIDHGYFTEIDMGMYYPSDKLHIPDEAVKALKQFITEKMGSQAYISLSAIEGYRSALPAIDFQWNPVLMKSILINNGYRQIERTYKDHRFDMIILVPESSTVRTLEELVYGILKDQYTENMHESLVYDFLADKGILRKKDYGKTLPHEIRKSSDRIQIDEIGIVELK